MAWIMAPKKKGPASLQVRGRLIHAEGVAKRRISMPVTDMRGGDPVRTTEGIEETSQPTLGVVDRRPAPSPFGQGHRKRPMLISYGRNALRDRVEGFLPTNPLPPGIGVSFGSCPALRVVEPVWMIDQVRGCPPLDAKHATVRMVRIGIESSYSTVFDRRYRGAMCGAEGAIPAHAVRIT